jgi:SAM-dependent methyltransferase
LSVPDLLSPAARAFDAVAVEFDRRYGEWRSVAAQRRAVRRELLRAFPRGARVLEIGGGTGEDALFLIRQGRDVLLTDASPAMVHLADAKLGARATNRPRVVPAEHLDSFAVERESAGEPLFDGAFSNFAALNCVTDQVPVARGLAGLVRPGARVLFVIFGTMSPGELVVQLLRREPAAAFRRLSRGDVRARLAKREFTVQARSSAPCRPGSVSSRAAGSESSCRRAPPNPGSRPIPDCSTSWSRSTVRSRVRWRSSPITCSTNSNGRPRRITMNSHDGR